MPYLFANGVRLAGVAWERGGDRRVFLELGGHIGSTSIVLDRATSELVERGTYMAYGAAESDYRPERWDQFNSLFFGNDDAARRLMILYSLIATCERHDVGEGVAANGFRACFCGLAIPNGCAATDGGRISSTVDRLGRILAPRWCPDRVSHDRGRRFPQNALGFARRRPRASLR